MHRRPSLPLPVDDTDSDAMTCFSPHRNDATWNDNDEVALALALALALVIASLPSYPTGIPMLIFGCLL